MRSFFISSTFKDMQAERDALHRTVFPALRQRLKVYGEDIQELDLRWGVDTSLMSEAESGCHVIENCVDAIDRCKPYMIVLIGERYGWIPDGKTVAAIHDSRVARWYAESISITQMEILYGALERDQLDHCIFCFRDECFSRQIPEDKRAIYQVESEEHQEKLRTLKARIRSTPGASIIEYCPDWENGQVQSLDGLTLPLTEALWEILENDLAGGILSPEEQILRDSRLTRQRYLSTYIPRADLSNPASVLTGRAGIWYYGEGGCGKGAFLSAIADGAESTGCRTFLYYCGGENCQQVDTLLGTLHFWLCKQLDEPSPSPELTRAQTLKSILTLLAQPRRMDLAIVIDGADEMEEDICQILILLAQATARDPVGAHIYALAVSSLDTYYQAHRMLLAIPQLSCKKLEGLGATEIIAMAQAHAAHRGKHLDPRTQSAIRAKAASSNPYYLSLVLQRLFMMRGKDFEAAEALAPGMEGLSLYMQNMIEAMPDNIPDMTTAALDHAARQLTHSFSAMPGVQAAPAALLFRLLAASHQGLSIQEMEALCAREGVTLLPSAFQQMLNFMYDSFRESADGRWNFSHRLLRQSLKQQMARQEQAHFAALLCRYYQEQGAISESLLYALESEDPQLLQNCFAAGADERCFTAYRAYLAEHEDVPQESNFLARMILADPDEAMKLQPRLLEMLSRAESGDPETRLLVSLAKLALLTFAYVAQDYIEELKIAGSLYAAVEDPSAYAVTEYFCALLTPLCYNRYQKYIPQIDSAMTEFEHSAGVKVLSEAQQKQVKSICTHGWALLLYAKDINKPPKKDALENLQQLCSQLHIVQKLYFNAQWEDCDTIGKKMYALLNALNIQAADAYCSWGKYQEASAIIHNLMPRLQERMQLFPSALERIQFANSMYVRVFFTKAEFAMQYVEEYRKQLEHLLALYPLDYCKQDLAFSYYLEGYVLEKLEASGKTEFDHTEKLLRAFRNGIRLYDELLAGKSDPEKPVRPLDMAAYLRFRRIKKRLSLDLWNWTDEKSLYFMSKSPMRGAALMEDDLARAEADTKLLLEKEQDPARLYELSSLYVFAARYYDFREEDARSLFFCRRFLETEQQILDKELKTGGWTSVTQYVRIGECFQHCGQPQQGAQCARTALSHLDAIPAESIEKRGQTGEARRLRLRCALLKLKASDTLDETEYAQAMATAETEDPKDEDLWLKSDLFQTAGELSLKAGDREKAIEYLQASADCAPEKITKLWFSRDESTVQPKLRFMEGQALLAELTQKWFPMNTVFAAMRKLVTSRTVGENTASRPRLLKFAQRMAEVWQTLFPQKRLSEDLAFVLLVTPERRKAHRLAQMKAQEPERLETLRRWEQDHPDIGSEDYLLQLQRLGKFYSEMLDNMDKQAPEWNAAASMVIRLNEKENAHYWAAGNVRYAIYGEANWCLEFTHRRELMEQLYSPEECWERCCRLRQRRHETPYIKRQVQVSWANITEFAVDVCFRLYDKTGDTAWLFQALEETNAARQDLARFQVNDQMDDEWNRETIRGFYTLGRQAWLKMQENGSIPEDVWLGGLLGQLYEQMGVKVMMVPPSFYTEALEMLYGLQSTVTDTAAVAKAIDTVTYVRSGGDHKFQFYMQKAARDLPADTPQEQVMAYIEALKAADEE